MNDALTEVYPGVRLYKIKTGIKHDIDNVPSPIKTLLPKLSEDETSDLPYPPDAYPNARDVESPYGSLRVYEFGPENGRKVMFVHGISNPCLALGAIAHGLVDKGCRVILFDLPGKGYSSTPIAPHSARLFTTCIFLALISSPIPWTGDKSSLSLIGYSLGGGICANFCSYFPSLVSSLVLIGPGGLVRKERVTFLNKFLFDTGLVPETLVEYIIKRRLQRGDPPIGPKKISPAAPVTAELPEEKLGAKPKSPDLSRARPGMTVSNVVVSTFAIVFMSFETDLPQPWQIGIHQGFIKSFLSSLRYGPVVDQHADWQRIGMRLSAQNAAPGDESVVRQGLQNGKVLIIGGASDALIVGEELVPDATAALGAGNVIFKFVDAGHDLPVTKSQEIVDYIHGFWEGDPSFFADLKA